MPRFPERLVGPAVASTVIALPFVLLAAYEFYQAAVARRAYEQCASLALPLDLADFRSKFGPPVGLYAGVDETRHDFEPNTGYVDFASGSISAVTQPGSTKVVKFFCGD